jgi:hypothetical protein
MSAADPKPNRRQFITRVAGGASALAAAGRGDDARGLPDKVVVMLRRQALRWLREDLALYARQAEAGEAAAKRRATTPHGVKERSATAMARNVLPQTTETIR